jgi:hypothetical protein
MYSLISQKRQSLYWSFGRRRNHHAIKESQEFLYAEIPKLERYFRILTENSLVANQERLMDNLSLPAENALKNFMPNTLLLIKSSSKTYCFLSRRNSGFFRKWRQDYKKNSVVTESPNYSKKQ